MSYALVAAAILNLVTKANRLIGPTSLGKELADTPVLSEAERRLFKRAVEESEELGELGRILLANSGTTASQLARAIYRQTNLSPETASHRAAMLFKWRRELLSPQLRFDTHTEQGMWRHIEIKNFRSIADASVRLAPFTVVVGPNGSGKSNFADALVFARDVAFDASAAISSRGGISGVRRWRPSKPTDVAIDVRAAVSVDALDTNYARHFLKIHSGKRGDWSFSSETVEIIDNSKRLVVKRKGSVIESSPKISLPSRSASVMVSARQLKQFAGVSALQNVRRYRLNPDAMRQPQLSTEDTRLKENGENIAAAILSIRETDQLSRVLEPMGRVVPGLENIYVEQVGRYLALKFTQTQEVGTAADFNATEMSEGALRALGIIVATCQMVRDELLIIEEPEVSIHVGAAALLFDILKEASDRGAVLLTTHSADLLDAAKDEEILVCEYAAGVTKIGPLSTKQRAIVRDGLFSVAELMRSERLRIEQ